MCTEVVTMTNFNKIDLKPYVTKKHSISIGTDTVNKTFLKLTPGVRNINAFGAISFTSKNVSNLNSKHNHELNPTIRLYTVYHERKL